MENGKAYYGLFHFYFCIISIVLHEEIMLLIQIISGDIQCFTEPLEVHDFSFSQELQSCQNGGIFCQIDEGFISRPCFFVLLHICKCNVLCGVIRAKCLDLS